MTDTPDAVGDSDARVSGRPHADADSGATAATTSSPDLEMGPGRLSRDPRAEPSPDPKGQPSISPTALRNWRNAICLAFGFGGFTLASWGPRLPAITQALHIDTATLGLVLGSVTIGLIVGLVCATPLLHWLRSRLLVGCMLVVAAIAIFVMGLSVAFGSVFLMAVAIVLVGFGLGTLDVTINVEGSAIERATGRVLMPFMHGSWSIGAAVGAGLGTASAALSLSASTQFIGEAVLLAVGGVVVGWFIAPGARGEQSADDQTRLQKIAAWARGWLDWRLLLIGVVMLGVELGEGSANNWLTLSMHDDHGQTPTVAALFFTVFAVSEAAIRIFGGPLVERLGRVATIRWTTALGAVGIVLFIVGGSWWVVLIGVILWALGVSMGFPLGMSAAAESGSDPAARVSVVASVGYLANMAGPPAIGSLAEHVGLLGALWSVVVLFIIGFACAGVLAPRKK
jgi:MFS family permease